MSLLHTFDINFVGLNNGVNDFSYQIDEQFFELYEYSLVKKGDLAVKLTFDKNDNFFTLEFDIEGTVELICDRCADPFNYQVKAVEQQLVKIEEEANDGVDDWIVLGKKDFQLNVASLIYEFIMISLPLINLHPDNEDGTSGCNPETISLLKRLSIHEGDSKTDPRWDALKNINPGLN